MIIYLLVSCNKQLFSTFACARQLSRVSTHRPNTLLEENKQRMCRDIEKRSRARERREKLLITTYQEVNDHLWSHTRCDDENVRIGGDTDLPEQHFHSKRKYKPNVSYISRKVIHHPSVEFSFCPVEVKECMCRDGDGVVRTTISTKVIASRPFRLRSKCSICSRRFESRRWSHRGQALSSGFLDIGRDHPSSLGPVPRIVSTLQCRRVRSTPVSFGKRDSHQIEMKRSSAHRGDSLDSRSALCRDPWDWHLVCDDIHIQWRQSDAGINDLKDIAF